MSVRQQKKHERVGHPACRKLRGYKGLWRIRVVYLIDDDRKMVSVTRVAHRRDVYE